MIYYIHIYTYVYQTCIVSVSVLAVVILLILQGLGDIMMEDVWLAAVILYYELFDNICIHTLHSNPLDTFPLNSLVVHL